MLYITNDVLYLSVPIESLVCPSIAPSQGGMPTKLTAPADLGRKSVNYQAPFVDTLDNRKPAWAALASMVAAIGLIWVARC